MTREAMQKELFIARRIVDAIDNFDELKIAYDEEKSVIREALVRFAHRIDAALDIGEGEE